MRGSLRPGSEHFQVTELPAYPPCGSGEHLYVEVRSRDLGSDRVATTLARACGVPLRAVGYAGRKDRRAVAQQWFSVLAGDPAALGKLVGPRPDGSIEVVQVSRHRNKLRRGHLRGNRFRLGLELGPDSASPLATRLEKLAALGLPNRFGPQRFGRHGANLEVARAWSRGEFAEAVARIVESDGSWRPGDPLPGRRGSGARGAVLAALARAPESPEVALLATGRSFRQFVASAAQSAIFNAVLEERQARGLLRELRAGDLAQLGDGPLFRCEAAELVDINRRAAPDVAEVFATGPLPGRSRFVPAPAVEAEERAWSAATDVDWSWFERDRPLASRGARRRLVVPLLEPPRLVTVGPDVWLELALPPGSYATVFLDEAGISLPIERAG